MGQFTSQPVPTLDSVVEIPGKGSIKGLTIIDTRSGESKSKRFTGIPYAQPPVGENRWRRPKRLSQDFRYDSQGREYKEFGPICWQPTYRIRGVNLPAKEQEYSEDCLLLNIWTPFDESRKPSGGWPVLFFIHGGWLQIGDPNQDPINDPSDLITKAGVECIVVAPGYRLNLFGFLAHEGLRSQDPEGITGNYGFWDQRMALEWTFENIAQFGGDPSNITVGGLSAGAHSTHSQLLYEFSKHCQDPSYQPIIRRVWQQSNAAVLPAKKVCETLSQVEELIEILGLDVGGKGEEEKMSLLRKVQAKELVEAIPKMKIHTFRAVREDLDGSFVRSDWYRAMSDGRFSEWCAKRGVRFLIGETDKEESIYSVVNPPRTKEELEIQLLNYYSEDSVKKLLPVYGYGQRNEAKDQEEKEFEKTEKVEEEDDDFLDLYSVLGVARNASDVEIRSAYLGLVKKHHPDKAQQLEKKRGGVMKPLHSSDKLIRSLNKAYSTLYNERTRKVYDSLLEKQTCQSPSSSKRKLRVSHVLDLDSFQVVERVQQERKDQEEEEEEEGEQENLTFLHPCRCGQSFEITLEQISSGVELVGCQGCSEIVKVLWKEDQEEEEGKGKQEGSSSPLTELEDVFGRITSDSQVYASERLLVQDLLRTNSTEVSKDRLHLTSDHVHRYRINYLSPCLSGIVPDWMGVSHSFDDAVWWCFMGTDLVKRRWLEDDPERKAILLQWLQPFAQFLNGSDSSSSWGTDPSGRSIRVLDSDGSISIQQDKRWSQKADVLRAMDEARCIL